MYSYQGLFKSQEVANLVKKAQDFGIKADFQGVGLGKGPESKNRVVKQLTSESTIFSPEGKSGGNRGFLLLFWILIL